MKLFFTSLAIAIVSICIGQTSHNNLKTKTIDYKYGKATIQYYEDSETSEQVKHGTFSYSENQKGEFGTQVVKITGKFVEGYRTGLWSYSIKKVDFKNGNGNYTTGTLTSTQNFKNGFPGGVWKLNHSWKTRGRIVNENYQYVWGSYSKINTESASFSFKKGVMIGKISYKADGVSNSINLNSDGFIYGDFTETYGGTRREKSFNSKGIMTKNIERLPSSGKILKQTDFDAELLKIANEYVTGKLTTDDLRNSQIKLDTINGEAEDAGILFYNDYFYLPGIGGDKTITKNGNKRIHGRYLKPQRIEIVYYKDHNEWPRTNAGPEINIIKYNKFIELYGQEVRKEDIKTIQLLIVEEQNKQEQRIAENKNRENQKSAEEEYHNIYKNLDSLLFVPFTPPKTKGLGMYASSDYSLVTYLRDKENQLNHIRNRANQLLYNTKYIKSDFSSSGYKETTNNYVSSLKVIREYEDNLINTEETKIDSLSKFNSFLIDITYYFNQIQCMYLHNKEKDGKEYLNSNGQVVVGHYKINLYNIYFEVSNNVLDKEYIEFNDLYLYIEMLSDMSIYMNDILKYNTNKFETELSSLTDYTQKLELFAKANNSSEYKYTGQDEDKKEEETELKNKEKTKKLKKEKRKKDLMNSAKSLW